jgi:hypothetical protein
MTFEKWMDSEDISYQFRLLMIAMRARIEEKDEIAAQTVLRTTAVMAYEVGVEEGLELAMVVDLKDDYESMPIPELAAELKRLKGNLDAFDAVKKEYQKAYDYLSISVLPERMDEAGVDGMKITDVGRLQLASDIRCSVPAKNKGAVQEWLRDHGHASMVTPTTNASTLKAFVKEMMRENKEYPESLLTISPYSRATVVKG